MAQGYLDKVYTAQDDASVRALYDAWSQTYDEEIARNGYATPGRCAEALVRHTENPTLPILDFGCGTGLSGLALKLAGFAVIDGVDLSPEMIEKARSKRLYRALAAIGPDEPLSHAPDHYSAIAAIGVIGPGAAPVSVLHRLIEALAPGAKLVFSLNDHALQDARFEACLNEWLDCGAARLLFREYGPHLPGIGLKANVYVLEKA